MRNPKKDEIEMTQRREKLLSTAFDLFAKNSIEAVKLQDIANESGIGIATLYRYFGNKPDMVIEIATAKWQEYYVEVEKAFQKCNGDSMNAAEELEFFLNCFIDLYQHHKDILRFNRNFDTYVKHKECTKEQMQPYNEAAHVFEHKFHSIYRKAQEDGTLSINISEKKLFVNLLYIMLSVAGKYAEGLIYPPDEDRDMTEELVMLKRMVLRYYSAEKRD